MEWEQLERQTRENRDHAEKSAALSMPKIFFIGLFGHVGDRLTAERKSRES
jgi:hypothetical protein